MFLRGFFGKEVFLDRKKWGVDFLRFFLDFDEVCVSDEKNYKSD